ncbi:MAG TPA: 7-cyano-7-deazaguanine synthase QueC [Tepidisphaeraceae bacterium]|jgi:7-cyano-7-deazaguanine synthase
MSQSPAIILLSGGLDSATVLAIAQQQGFECHAISFRYGQRHEHELSCAAQLAQRMNAVSHTIINFDLRPISNSALTGSDKPIPKGRDAKAMSSDIPVTYVPARNTIFLSFALAKAETIGSRDIFIGVNALDYSGYPDCRPEYIRAYEAMANLATKAATQEHQHLTIHAPLIAMTKAQIIRRGIELGVDYSLTTTCYDPSPTGKACGQCDACLLRKQGFAENGLADPALV